MDKSLEEQKAHAEKEIYQLENRQKILLNRIRKEERNARTSRLCKHGAILEGVFPAVLDADGEAIKAFLIALSRLPGASELAEKTLNAGDAGQVTSAKCALIHRSGVVRPAGAVASLRTRWGVALPKPLVRQQKRNIRLASVPFPLACYPPLKGG